MPGEGHHLEGHVGVTDAGLPTQPGSRLDLQVGDGGLEAVLDRTEVTTGGGERLDGSVDGVDGTRAASVSSRGVHAIGRRVMSASVDVEGVAGNRRRPGRCRYQRYRRCRRAGFWERSGWCPDTGDLQRQLVPPRPARPHGGGVVGNRCWLPAPTVRMRFSMDGPRSWRLQRSARPRWPSCALRVPGRRPETWARRPWLMTRPAASSARTVDAEPARELLERLAIAPWCWTGSGNVDAWMFWLMRMCP